MTEAVPVRTSRRTWFRTSVVVGTAAAAAVGSVLLATRGSGPHVTTQGITTTLQVADHPGSLVAGQDALWLALHRDSQRPGESSLVRVDPDTGVVERRVALGGEASHVSRVEDRVIASVRRGEDELRERRLIALDWRSGNVLVRRGFRGPVDRVVRSGGDLWALETRPGALLRLDPLTLAPTAPRIRLSSGRALDLAVGGGYLWVTAADAGELLRIDPLTRAVSRIRVGGFPVGIALGGGTVWYADPTRGEVSGRDMWTLEANGPTVHVGGKPTWLATAGGSLFAARADDGTVWRIDVRSRARIGLPIRVAAPSTDAVPFALAATVNAVWVSSSASNTVTRIGLAYSPAPLRMILASRPRPGDGAADRLPRGGKVVATVVFPTEGGIFNSPLTAGAGAVWAFSDTESSLMRIDPDTNSIVARVEIVMSSSDAAVGEGSVWLSHPGSDRVSRVDTSTNRVTTTIPVGPEPWGLAVSPGAIWVANNRGPSVSRIDPATNRIVATIPVGPNCARCGEGMLLTASESAVWVALPNAKILARIDPATNTVTNSVDDHSAPCASITADDDVLWGAGGPCGDYLLRVDARTGRLTTTVEGEPFPVGLALYDGSLWVASWHASSVDRIDPDTGLLTARLPLGARPVRLAVGFGAIWVTDIEGRVLRIEPDD